MKNSQYTMSPQLSEELKRLNDAEKHALETYRERTDENLEPFTKSYFELKERTPEDETEKIVIEQINEMFL